MKKGFPVVGGSCNPTKAWLICPCIPPLSPGLGAPKEESIWGQSAQIFLTAEAGTLESPFSVGTLQTQA